MPIRLKIASSFLTSSACRSPSADASDTSSEAIAWRALSGTCVDEFLQGNQVFGQLALAKNWRALHLLAELRDGSATPVA